MKKLLLFLCIAASAKTKATIITVSNAINSPAQYTDLQLAINAANNGDTIYVSGSNSTYGNVVVNKKLVLIGTGFNPQKEFPVVAQLNSLAFDSIIGQSSGAGSVIDGFDFLPNTLFQSLSCGSGTGTTFHNIYSITCVNNVTIRRNQFASVLGVGGANWMVENNIAKGIYVWNNINVVIRNNIVREAGIHSSNHPNTVISNNLFIASNIAFSFIENANITNNIFYGNADIVSTSSTFNNNLTFNTGQPILPYGSNVGSGNINNQDPQFTSIQTLNYQFNPLDNYKLLATSPGHNAGTDGTDIGPYGGASPFPSSPIGGEPQVPQVKNMNINNSNLPLNGNLNINVKGKKQD
jgi:hypothetical protein